MIESSSNMNILFFSRLFYPHVGGVEKHVMEISRILIKKGYKVTIVAEQNPSKTKLREVINGIEVFRIPKLKDGKLKKIKIWKWLWGNIRLIKNADIVHCHDVFFWYLPFKFIFPLKKVFTTFHGYESYPLKQKNILVRKISEKLSIGNICIGDFIKKWYGTKPTYVSYGAVEIPNSKLQISNKIKQESAVFMGRLDEQTGVLTYFEAVRKIREKIPDFKLTVFGDGKFKNKNGEGLEFKGFIDNAQKQIYKYNLVFASRYLSILEAMAAKKLVFAVYNNPIKEDYLKMSPFSKYIIISESSSDLISKILFFRNNEKLKNEMIEKGFAWIKKHTWKEMVNTYIELWNRNL